ncbi:hypothetical protein EMPS_04513 [Entomortierella parvispora]|uniref:CsbD-like domain-containing protein n=1 Tax=Entomortierella parvispora TaxID=205924 RepID=A0A9P3H8L8_9FUNG|nr:hypothetical protein EMPS_04513 [Entomortierella parvispora]
MTDRFSNTANSYMGGAKQTLGNAIGNSTMAAEGAAKKAQADAAQATADAKTHAEGLRHSIGGNVQKTVGSLVGNSKMEAEGHANIARGEVKRNV